MKHYPPSALTRLATVAPRLHEHCDVVEHVRSLVITDGKAAVAKRLGMKQERLTKILRGRCTVPDRALAALGYRRVVGFERLPIQANRGSPAERKS